MYILKVEIKNLWGKDFSWKLNEDVNVLIGMNGSGKSTILKILKEAVLPIDDSKLDFRLFDPIDEIIIEMDNDIVIRVNSESRIITGLEDNSEYELNIKSINNFDVVEKSLNPNMTLLDYHLDKLKLEFVTYQRDLSNKVEEAFKIQDKTNRETKLEDISAVYEAKNTFLTILEKEFERTEKRFEEKSFSFFKVGIETPILPQKLSSGEKQILIILLSALLQDRRKHVLIMDEPEISLHLDWQRSLIENIKKINPSCQIIIATHSPTLYYQGWTEHITRIENIQRVSDSESDILKEKIVQSQDRVQKIKSAFQGFSGNKPTKLYQFNREINTYTTFTKEECIDLLSFLHHENKIHPDVITFTTFISKINNFSDAKEIFDLIQSQNYTSLSITKPNEITLNTLIKKAVSVEQGLQLIQEVGSNEKLQLYPNVITFSTLLGKAKNSNEIDLVEKMRRYYRVQTNDIYLSKLNSKR
jgi:energy-coupling factor transporter ATP-binding protein EcfA2